MIEKKTCPDCGAVWKEKATCQDHFHRMLFWEAENQAFGEVHHLTVLCYYLQHPSLYSPAGLESAKKLLKEFVINELSPQAARTHMLSVFKSDQGKPKITATENAKGFYRGPVSWRMTTIDVIKGGPDGFRDNVRAWSHSILETLKATGNFER